VPLQCTTAQTHRPGRSPSAPIPLTLTTVVLVIKKDSAFAESFW
jgi:hypothetical protein